MSKRHRNAIDVQKGASNPRAVSRVLVEAVDEAAAENPDTDSICEDSAVRLIAHQLSWLLGIQEINNDLPLYRGLLEQCESHN